MSWVFVSLPKFLLKISVQQYWIVTILAGMKPPWRVICVLHFGYLTTEIKHPKELEFSQESHAWSSRETEHVFPSWGITWWMNYFPEASPPGTTTSGLKISIYKILREYKWGRSVEICNIWLFYLWKLNSFIFSFEMLYIKLYSLVFNVS